MLDFATFKNKYIEEGRETLSFSEFKKREITPILPISPTRDFLEFKKQYQSGVKLEWKKTLPITLGPSGEAIISPTFQPVKEAKIPKADFFDKLRDIQDRPEQLVPFLSSGVEAVKFGKLLSAANRLKGDKATDEDLTILQEYVDESTKETDFGYKVLDVVSFMPSFMGELLLTSGVATFGRVGAMKVSKEILKFLLTKSGRKLLEKQLAQKGLRVAGGIAGRTLQAPVAGATRITAGTLEKQLESTLSAHKQEEIATKYFGDEEFEAKKEDLFVSFKKALGEQWVETLSEFSGGLLTGLSKPIKNKLLKVALFTAFKKANPVAKVDDLAKIVGKMGYHGVIGEMFEERMAEVGHGILNELGLSDQEFRLPSGEQLAIEFVAFSVPGVAVGAVNQLDPTLEKIKEGLKKVKPGLTIEDVSKGKPEAEIPKELEPLAKEARKYKSAEEFVKDFEKIGEKNAAKIERGLFVKPDDYVLVYHGTPSLKNLASIEKTGFKLGMKKSFQGKENAIYVNLDKNVGIYAQDGGIIKARVKSKYLISDPERAGQFYVQNPNYVEVLEKGIYEGTHLYPTFKPATQLTDFYTQATKGIEEVRPEKIIKAAEVKPKITTKAIIRKTTEQVKPGMVEFKQRMTDLVRGLREGRILTKDEITKAQTEIIDILDKSALERSDKAKFIRAIKNVQTKKQLEKTLPEIQERIETLEIKASKRTLRIKINKELKYVKPLKVGQKRIAKYDYQTNKFLEGLRKDNKLNQEQAQLKLDKIPTEELSELDKIEARFLSLKSNGSEASILLHEQVLADIKYLKKIGEAAKDEADFIKKIEKQEKVDEILDGIKQQKSSSFLFNIFKKLETAYVSSVANLYSTINTIAGKKIADKYDYGIFQTNSQYSFSEQVEKATDNAKEIYDAKNNRQLTKIFLEDLAIANWIIIDITGLKTEINRFNLIDIYNATKNDLIKERYNNAFGELQVNALLQNLTQEDVKLADYLMKEVQSYKDILNKRSIEVTGRDLGDVENYWPSTSEFKVDFYDDIKIQGETPSAMKRRVKNSKIIPRIDNAWLKFQKHIAQGEHIKTLSKKYEELKKLFSNRVIKHNIKNKFDNEVYTTLIDHIETFSLNKRTQSLDVFSGVYSTALNNWVKAKIASPTVFARQLISSIYSIEEVGIKNFLKYQKEAVDNPKMAFDYMWKNIPFLSSRFKQGYSEALQDAIRGSSELKVGMDSITKYVTLLTRGGDISAIIINGYPIIKTEMAKHGNMEKAIEKFQKFSEKTQQSATRANLSRLQRERNAFARTFFRFKNTTNQLLRLQTDATIQYINKQISVKEFATKTTLYSIYTPLMYVLVGYLITQGFKRLFGTDDEEKKESLFGDILAQIIIQPFQALPLLDMAAENAYAEIRKRMTDKTYYFGGGMFSYPLLDDIETGWSKLKKKEPSASDFLRVFSLLQEPTTGIPTETILRYYGYTEPKEKKGGIELEIPMIEMSLPEIEIPTIEISL